DTWLQGVAGPFEWLISTVGSLAAAIVLTWLLFPVVTGAFVALFLERVARTVEQQHYPHLPIAKGLPLVQGLVVSMRFMIVLIAANALLLILLLAPPVYAVAWF